MEVIEAKQGFLSWNEKNFDDYLSRLDPEQKSALKILPLLFQTNDRLLPGYSGPDAPAGIYGYLPNTSVINEAKTFHDKFRYNQERPLKITIIESIYLQHNVLNDEMNLWVLHVEKLRPEQLSDLRDKCEKIKTWLLSRNVHVSTSVSTVKRLLKKTSPPAIFLDSFYFQSYLLAGKYPVWWLVPPEKENDYDAFVDHIITAKFVNSQEFLNLGRLGGLNHDDVLKLAIKHARNVYKSPELSFLELLLLMRKQRVLPEVDGVASVIKKKIYSNKKNYDEYSTHNVVADVLIKELEVLSQERTENKNPVVSHFKMFGLLSCYSNTASRKMLKTLSGDYKVSTRDVGVSEYLDFNKVLFSEVGEVYALLLDKCNAKNKADNKDSKLASLSNNMRSFLSKGESRVPVFITQNKTEFILDRMLLKHNIENDISDSWSLIMQMNEGEEKTISVFNDLISLIIWAWLNRVADRSTQISISCPKYW